MLKQINTTLYLQKRTEQTIEIIKQFEPHDDYYHLCFSGGKDSIVLKDLADRANVKYQAIYNVTTMDPPPVLNFMREYHPDVKWDYPETSFVKQVGKRGLPFRSTRWCCGDYKDRIFTGKTKLLGVRHDERRISGAVGLTRICNRTGETAIQPLWNWSNEDIWTYIHQRELPYCSLYDEGWTRIGCMCCPFASYTEKLQNYKRWPGLFHAIQRNVSRRWWTYWLPTNSPVTTRFRGPDDLYWWWFRGDLSYPSIGQQWKSKKT